MRRAIKQVPKRILIVPNAAIACSTENLKIEASLPLLLDPIVACGHQVTLGAVVFKEIKGNYIDVRNASWKLYQLNGLQFHGKLGTIANYLLGLPKYIKCLLKADFTYIFLPGNVGLIFVLLAFIMRKDYGLYVRGDIIHRNKWLLPLYKHVIRKSTINLCTGFGLVDYCKKLNPESYPVVPMSPLVGLANQLSLEKKHINSPLRLLYVGQLTNEKGVQDLLKAIGILVDRNCPIECTVVGDGDGRSDFEAYVLRHNLEKVVTFTGSITDASALKEYFVHHDVFCLPSYTEGFPRVIYEALAFQLLILSTPVGRILDVLEHDKNALIFAPGNVNELSDLLQQVISDEALRLKVQAGGAKTWNELKTMLFSHENHGTQLLKHLQLNPCQPA